MHLRPDADIQRDIVEEIFRRVLGVRDGFVSVDVADGAVTLAGELDTRSAVETAGRLTAKVSGVVRVSNDLTFAVDDSVITASGTPTAVA